MVLSREQIQSMKSRLNKVSSDKDFNTFVNIWFPMVPSLKNDLFEQLFLLNKRNTFDSRLEAMHNVIEKYSEDLLNAPPRSRLHTPASISNMSRTFTKKLEKMATKYLPQKGSGPSSFIEKPILHIPRTYTCKKCNATFTDPYDIKQHSTSHYFDSPTHSLRGTPTSPQKGSGHIYQCPYCPYTSSSSSNLTRHTRKHTGDKPFQCPSCPFKSSTSSNLKSHVQKIHTKVDVAEALLA